MEVITAPNVKQDMWYDGLSGFFTGLDDPNYCVLKFTAQTGRYYTNFSSENFIVE
jgi:general stress protein 26